MRDSEITRDSLFDGEVICLQHRNGYRFSVDPVILAHFCQIKRGDKILDLGTGCGVIPLILAYRHQGAIKDLTGLEYQQGLAELARENFILSGSTAQFTLIEGDVTKIKESVEQQSFHRVVCNPPFYQSGNGRENGNEEVRIARHQIHANVEDFLTAASFSLKNSGLAYFIYPADYITHFMSSAKKHRLEPKRIQFIYNYPETTDNANLVLVQCRKNGRPGTKIMPPFFVYEKREGPYSSEMKSFYDK